MQHVLELLAHGVLHAAQLAHRGADLAGDLREALWAENDQRDHENEDDLFGSEAHGEKVPTSRSYRCTPRPIV